MCVKCGTIKPELITSVLFSTNRRKYIYNTSDDHYSIRKSSFFNRTNNELKESIKLNNRDFGHFGSNELSVIRYLLVLIMSINPVNYGISI